MKAKEQLAVVVDSLTEAEATDALEYLSRTRPAGTSTQELLDSAPLDDEPFTKEDVRALAEARAEPDGVSLEEALRAALSGPRSGQQRQMRESLSLSLRPGTAIHR